MIISKVYLFLLLSCVDSKVEHATKLYGQFELGPFAPGQALTVANALRRSLLSQLSGSAITLVEIQGATNEYEILNGVRESILDILLNLKQVVLTSDLETFSPQVGFLNVKGPGIIRAGDLKLPAFLYTIDPNQYITTLSAKGMLNMKFLVCCGKNYITYNLNDSQYSEGVLLLKQAKPLGNVNLSQKTVTNIQTDPLIFLKEKKAELNIGRQSSNSQILKSESVETKTNSSSVELNFYQQWSQERDSFKNNELNLIDSQQPKSRKTLKSEFFISKQRDNLLKTKTDQSLNSDALQKEDSTILEKNGKLEFTTKRINSTFKATNSKIGYFPIDALFMPVNRVNYLIEANDNFSPNWKGPKDRVILEVWTNGSIHPRHAIHKAAKALIQLFLPLQQMRTSFFQLTNENLGLVVKKNVIAKRNSKSPEKRKNKVKSNAKLKNHKLDSRLLELDIGNLELTARPYSRLKMANIDTISNLISYSKEDLLSLKNFGRRSLNEVEKALQLMHLSLKS